MGQKQGKGIRIDERIVMDESRHDEHATWVGRAVLKTLKESIEARGLNDGNIEVGPIIRE